MAQTKTDRHVLSEDILARCLERAPVYDRENRFFTEDFEELRQAGYLIMAVPKELGGLGMSLAEVCREQRRLAYHAPATALAINMHLYWTGVAADLWRAGDKSLEWLLKAAVAGKVFAAGHAETGNDIPLLLDAAFVPDNYIARVVPAGAAGVDHFVLAIFAWALSGFANIYYGLAQRALNLHNGFGPGDIAANGRCPGHWLNWRQIDRDDFCTQPSGNLAPTTRRCAKVKNGCS